MIIIIKLITFIIGTLIILKMTREFFLKENYNIIFYPSVVFYFFMYIPIISDVVIGRPQYGNIFYGFILSGEDLFTEIVYCLAILYILYIFRLFQKRNNFLYKADNKKTYANTFFIVATLIMTILLLPIVVDKELMSVIVKYEVFENSNPIFQDIGFYGHYIILIILFVLMLEKNAKIFFAKLILLSPYIILGLLINGKRNIVFIFVIGLLFILISNKIIKQKIIYIFLIPIIAILLFNYSSNYQEHFGRLSEDSFSVSYSSFRVNYGRDDTMKMAIYPEIHKKENFKILDHRGQSMLFYPTFFIRRTVWPEKPFPYAVYFTSTLLGIKESRPLGWGMTTSIIDEFISNLGILGLLISPFFFIFFSKLGMKYNSGLLGNLILNICVMVMIMAIAVEITAFLSMYIILGFMVIIYKIKSRYKFVWR